MPRSAPLRRLRGSAPLFAALGDETRIALVVRLCEGGPASITKLSQGAEVTRQAVTKHLRVLEGAGLVESTRDGRESVWQLQPRKLSDARACLEAIAEEWDHAIDRLRAFVEK